MASINIPESAYPAIQHLIRLTPADFDAFLEALARATPALDQENFWSHVVPHISQVEQSVIKSIVTEILQIATAMSMMDVEIDDFASAIADAAASVNSKNFSFAESDKSILKDRTVRVFEGRKGLSITTKAMGVVVDQDRIFYSAKILTDVRPVFDEKGDSVDAAVIVHNLRIHYGQDGDHKDFYVALDTSDLQDLREVLDRADVKAKTLEGLLKRSGVSYLDAGE